ncbi:hypothetical protein MLAC_37860 [Mycobacterium lacus]|uniref:Uncharacterized protein n=1 Tax=Mycobacterium lacus TaxID=169765 RepID=A0A7I7NPF3_9MYCO|nr:hypothetical protein MLAC_37860 [Mycobacterium lacus]
MRRRSGAPVDGNHLSTQAPQGNCQLSAERIRTQQHHPRSGWDFGLDNPVRGRWALVLSGEFVLPFGQAASHQLTLPLQSLPHAMSLKDRCAGTTT